LTRIRCTVVDGMLAILARITGFAGACIIVDMVEALAVILAWYRYALVDVDLASRAGPSWMADAFMTEEIVHANAVQAGIARAQIDLLVAPFAGESRRAVAREVGDQIGAIGSEQTGSLGAIVRVDFTALTLPAWQTLALVATLLKSHASRAVVARISAGCARINLQRYKIK